MICLDHVHIFSSNMAKTLCFYQTMFGAKLVYGAVLMEQRKVRLYIGGQAMHIYHQKPRGTDRGLVHHLGIPTDDLDGLVAQ